MLDVILGAGEAAGGFKEPEMWSVYIYKHPLYLRGEWVVGSWVSETSSEAAAVDKGRDDGGSGEALQQGRWGNRLHLGHFWGKSTTELSIELGGRVEAGGGTSKLTQERVMGHLKPGQGNQLSLSFIQAVPLSSRPIFPNPSVHHKDLIPEQAVGAF